MNTEKVFAKMLKAKSNGTDVSVVTNYANTKKLFKYFLSLPDTYIVDVEIGEVEWRGYDGAYLLDLCADGGIYVQPAILDNGSVARGEGLYFIDVSAIGEHLPEDFVFESEETVIKLIGGN